MDRRPASIKDSGRKRSSRYWLRGWMFLSRSNALRRRVEGSVSCCHCRLRLIRSATQLGPDFAVNSFSNRPFLQFIRSVRSRRTCIESTSSEVDRPHLTPSPQPQREAQPKAAKTGPPPTARIHRPGRRPPAPRSGRTAVPNAGKGALARGSRQDRAQVRRPDFPLHEDAGPARFGHRGLERQIPAIALLHDRAARPSPKRPAAKARFLNASSR